MIRINLLPTKAVVRVTTARTQLIVAGVAVLLSLSGVLFWANSLNSKINKLEDKIKVKKQELKQVEKERNKLNRIKKTNEELKRKLGIIENIEKARTGPVWMMDQLTETVSHFRVKDYKTGKVYMRYLDDKVFIKTLKVSKGGKLAMTGIAINNTYLVAFLRNLQEKSSLFRNVKLHFSDTAKYQKALVRKFKITCKVNLKAKPKISGLPVLEPQDKPKSTTSGQAKKVSSRAGGR